MFRNKKHKEGMMRLTRNKTPRACALCGMETLPGDAMIRLPAAEGYVCAVCFRAELERLPLREVARAMGLEVILI